MPVPHILVTTDDSVATATVLFRYRGKLQLTVVVKASFTLVPDGAATPTRPGEIFADDRTFDQSPTRSVEFASDLAPYRARCDVTFCGHAYAPGGRAAQSGSVRLGLARDDGRPLLDKVLHVFGDRAPGASAGPFTKIPLVYERAVGGPGEANPVGTETPNVIDPADARRPAGYAPISRYWPARKQLLRGVDRAAIGAPIAVLPDAMPWDYYQAAPPDQQVEPLRGGEWLVLDGMHPSLPRVQTRLPATRGAARVLVRGAAAPVAIELVCDTLAIDGDRMTCSLVWRGRHEVAGDEAALASITLAAALDAPGVGIDWARLFEKATAVAPPAPPPAEAVGEGTMAVSLDEAAALVQRPIVPFAGPSAPSSARASTSSAATPWAVQAMKAAPLAAPGEATLGPGVADAPGEGTFALPSAQHASAAMRAVAPFAIQSPSATPARPQSSEGLPFGGAAPVSTPVASVGEETMALGAARPPIAAPPMIAAPPLIAAPPKTDAPPQAASTWTAPPPVAAPPRPPAARPPPKPQAPARPAPPPPPQSVGDRLRAAGASAADVSALLQALAPPPPLPDDD